VAGAACRFLTSYDTTLWPIRVVSAKWLSPHELSPPVRAPDAFAALKIELECAPDVTFKSLELERLRFHIRTVPALAAALYEILCNNCIRILARDPSTPGRKEPMALPGTALRPVGFEEDEGLLPVPRRAFVGYRLLQEYFTFPDKFLFFDVERFGEIRAACPGSRAELIFLVSPFERADRSDALRTDVTTETLRLGCTPAVNLFAHVAEPIQINQRRHEYMVVADSRRRAWTSVFSVEDVVATSLGSDDVIKIEPFHALRHAADRNRPTIFWSARRRPSGWRDDKGTDVHISFVDLSSRTVFPDADTATARVLCFNEDLPSRLPFGNPRGDFEMPGGGPIKSIVALIKPTEPVHPPLGRPQLWRLISQLSLNYMSLVEGGPKALRELLRLHNFRNTQEGDRHIDGILSVNAQPTFARIEGEHGLTFARGQRVEIEFDEEEYAGGGVYLLASVLERFLGLYVSLNSFAVLAARTKQRRSLLREWAPRSGWKALL
jgi:type VI secretion system protein ImpG